MCPAPEQPSIAYIRSSSENIDTEYEPWRDLVNDIPALRLTVYDIADRLRSAPPSRSAAPAPSRCSPRALPARRTTTA
ncbi:hypothetical protein ACFTZF_43785 [Streptomyces mirabilis]|uniref:hypothetical protein n=1 Tax=Streptomyces mirabilis TaxID=68239 RepID=UPI003625941A